MIFGQRLESLDLYLWEEYSFKYQIVMGHPIKPQYRGFVN